MKKAVLFLTFNRLDTTKLVFEQLKEAKPPRLYLASDGARKYKKGEAETVNSIRKWLLDSIDWECEVKTLFRDENLGCGKSVSSAISWFFQNEESGIILEDDCIPSQSFFNFCDELLDYYKNDKSVWQISGDQFVDNFNSDADYYFTKVPEMWGWATWADRWEKYQFGLKDYNERYITNFSNNKLIQKYWLRILRSMKKFEIDTWDYQWIFQVVKNNGFCINPSKNLIKNIGYNGVHYKNGYKNPNLNRQIFEIHEINHPLIICYDEICGEYFHDYNTIELKTKVSLFGFLPIFNSLESLNKTKIYLFNFIPFLSITKKKNKTKIYLFNFILLLKIKLQ